jgi:hypothetical protein
MLTCGARVPARRRWRSAAGRRIEQHRVVAHHAAGVPVGFEQQIDEGVVDTDAIAVSRTT